MHLFIRFLNYLGPIVYRIYSESSTVGMRINSSTNLVLNCDANEISRFRSMIWMIYQETIIEKENFFDYNK